MSAAAAQLAPRFVRRTTLNEHEYRVNFKQIDNDVIKALTSPEAREVTPLMATIYLGLLAAPSHCWERDGVLHFTGEDREAGRLTAWEQMRELAGVANSTLAKAVEWMNRTGVIGYDARANGVGIRVFFNRAAASIKTGIRAGIKAGVRPGLATPGQKNLRLVPTPSGNGPTPTSGAPFKESEFENNRDNNFPRAFAREGNDLDEKQPAESATSNQPPSTANSQTIADEPASGFALDASLVAALTSRIAAELQPEIAATVKRETDGAREWWLKYGLPKATRVAQRETYDLLRSHGVIAKKSDSGGVGRYDAAAEPGGAGQSERESLAAFLAETSQAVRQAATAAHAADGRELGDACHAAGAELDQLRDRIRAGELPGLDELGDRLTAIDAALAEALWRVTDPAEREAMLKTASAELHGYATRMEREAFADTARRRVLARLRELHAIPCLNLFYLSR